MTRTRYLLPAFPLLAVAAAGLLPAAISLPAVTRLARLLTRGAALAAGIGAGLLAVAASGLAAPRLLPAAAGFSLLALLLASGWRQQAPRHLAALLAASCFGATWLVYMLVQPVYPDTPAYEIVDCLNRAEATRVFYPRQTPEMTRAQTDSYKEKIASQVRVLSGGAVRVDRLALARYRDRTHTVLPMIVAADDRNRFPESRFTVVPTGRSFEDAVRFRDLLRLAVADDRPTRIAALATPYYILFPKSVAWPPAAFSKERP